MLSALYSMLFSWPVLLFIVALAVLSLRFTLARKILSFLIGLIPALILSLIGLAAIVLWWPVSWLADRLRLMHPVNGLAQRALRSGAAFKADPLLQGERETAAKNMWPEEAFPDLYRHAPEDLRRLPYEDGRLLGGLPMTSLADRHLTDAALRSAISGGVKATLVVFVAMLIVFLLQMLSGFIGFGSALTQGERPIVEQWPGAEPLRVSTWSMVTANLGPALSNLGSNIGNILMSLVAAIPFALGAGIVVTLLLLAAWMRTKGEPYRLVTKDADVRWPYRAETRLLLQQTYRRQLDHAWGYLKDKLTYSVGVATGTVRARGDIAAPNPAQPLKLDGESLFQHLLVFGGTGEGKTTALLKPLMRQIFADKNFGAFVADAKGVLWRDAQAVAEGCGRGNDVVVLGTGPGQKGIDPIANLTPTQVAATLRSVLRQTSGDAKDSFWPEMAANVIRHALTIGRAYALTPDGKAEQKSKGVNPYSLWWAYQAIILPSSREKPGPLSAAAASVASWRHEVEDASVKAEQNGDQQQAIAIRRELNQVITTELYASIEYIQGAWASMAPDTRTGIIASVTQLLDGFSGAPVLRERFASGQSENTADLRAALDGKIILNALSSIEDGLPARLTSILIKTALYREARVREAEWKRTRPNEKPQDRPCLVIMDEVQELATVDPASGLSDASFWNVARSTGLAGVFATQTVAALTQSMGKEAADNFIQQTRSKVFFRTEDRETVDYACWCAGEYERNRVFEEGQHESLEFRTLIDGWNPLAPVDEEEEIKAGPMAFFRAAIALIAPGRLVSARTARRPVYDVDERFLASDPAGSGSNAAAMSSAQAAVWRAEDLARQYRTQGNERLPALSPADMFHLGRWHAFAQIQRAGALRQDIIVVEHDFK